MSLINREFPTSMLNNAFFGGFDDFFSTPLWKEYSSPLPLLNRIDRDPDMILRKSSPCYEITENDKQYQLSLDVPGVKADDIVAQVENDGKVLHISGGRKMKKTEKDGTVNTSETKFEKRFVLDKSIDADKITANLQDGVLTITAPKHVDRQQTRKIAITNGHPAPELHDDAEKTKKNRKK